MKKKMDGLIYHLIQTLNHCIQFAKLQLLYAKLTHGLLSLCKSGPQAKKGEYLQQDVLHLRLVSLHFCTKHAAVRTFKKKKCIYLSKLSCV